MKRRHSVRQQSHRRVSGSNRESDKARQHSGKSQDSIEHAFKKGDWSGNLTPAEVDMLRNNKKSVCASFVLGACVVLLPVTLCLIYKNQFDEIDDLWKFAKGS